MGKQDYNIDSPELSSQDIGSRCNEYVINGFTHDEITELIHEIA